MGWLVLRFWEQDVLKNLEDCLAKIDAAVLYRVYEKELYKKVYIETHEEAYIDAMFYLAGE